MEPGAKCGGRSLDTSVLRPRAVPRPGADPMRKRQIRRARADIPWLTLTIRARHSATVAMTSLIVAVAMKVVQLP